MQANDLVSAFQSFPVHSSSQWAMNAVSLPQVMTVGGFCPGRGRLITGLLVFLALNAASTQNHYLGTSEWIFQHHGASYHLPGGLIFIKFTDFCRQNSWPHRTMGWTTVAVGSHYGSRSNKLYKWCLPRISSQDVLISLPWPALISNNQGG